MVAPSLLHTNGAPPSAELVQRLTAFREGTTLDTLLLVLSEFSRHVTPEMLNTIAHSDQKRANLAVFAARGAEFGLDHRLLPQVFGEKAVWGLANWSRLVTHTPMAAVLNGSLPPPTHDDVCEVPWTERVFYERCPIFPGDEGDRSLHQTHMIVLMLERLGKNKLTLRRLINAMAGHFPISFSPRPDAAWSAPIDDQAEDRETAIAAQYHNERFMNSAFHIGWQCMPFWPVSASPTDEPIIKRDRQYLLAPTVATIWMLISYRILNGYFPESPDGLTGYLTIDTLQPWDGGGTGDFGPYQIYIEIVDDSLHIGSFQGKPPAHVGQALMRRWHR